MRTSAPIHLGDDAPMIRRAASLPTALCAAIVLLPIVSGQSRADVTGAKPPGTPAAVVTREAEAGAAADAAALENGEAAAVPATPAATATSGPPLPPFEYDPKRKLKFDWLQTDSGEWLKGEIVRMHRHKLHFDSDEFGEVTFDWGNVLTLVSKNVVTIRVENADALTARLGMRGKVARMYTAEGIREIPQDKVLGMISGTPTERNYWSGGASIGVSVRAGNTVQSDVTLRANLVRQTEMTRWRTTYTGEISTVTGNQTANSHRVPSQFDVYVTRRFFLSTPSFEYYTDQFQNIGSRITAGAGLGYEWIDISWLHWEVGAGLAYQYTNYVSVTAGDDDADHDAAFVLKTQIDFDLRYGIEWDNLYVLQIVATDTDKTNHHAESALSFDVWGPLEFEIAFIFDRIEMPVPSASGNRPLSNDYRLTAGLGFDF